MYNTISRFLDGILVFGALRLAVAIRGISWTVEYILLGLLAAFLTLAFFQNTGLYRVPPRSTLTLLPSLLQAWGGVLVVLLILGWASRSTHYYSRLALAVWAAGTPMLLWVWRWGVGWFRRFPSWSRARALLIGAPLHEHCLQVLQEDWGLDIRVLFGSPAPTSRERLGNGPVLTPRPLEEVIPFLRQHQQDIDVVVAYLSWDSDARVLQVLKALQDIPVRVYLLPDFAFWPLFAGRVEEVGGLPLVALFDSPLSRPEARLLKRLEDLVIGSVALLLFAPVMAVIALLIKLESPGPVLFAQRRYGQGGREFRMWKFRTMRVVEDGDQVRPASQNDPRVTRIGRWLRRFSLDELPQLFNVLKGEMSLVGPRPFAVSMDDVFRKEIAGFIRRYHVKPGMTGWAQVNGWRGEIRTREDLLKRLEHDLYYILNWSLWFDLKILWLTLWRGFYHPKAY